MNGINDDVVNQSLFSSYSNLLGYLIWLTSSGTDIAQKYAYVDNPAVGECIQNNLSAIRGMHYVYFPQNTN